MHQVLRYQGRYYSKLDWDNVECNLCAHRCAIAPSRPGSCGTRTNKDGEVVVDNYARLSSIDVVTSEQLPLYNFLPDGRWLLLSGRGCTMRCPFCNQAKYSQAGAVRTMAMTPDEIVAEAFNRSVTGISFGVNEPAQAHEFVYDVMLDAMREGLNTHVATAGMWDPEALREILPVLSSMTLGLKGLDEDFYQLKLGGNLQYILSNLDIVMHSEVRLEITWLLIPGVTDKAEQIEVLYNALRHHEHYPPLVLLPFVPSGQWITHEPATIEHLDRFRFMLKDYKGPVYIDHPESAHRNTACGNCGTTLVRRSIVGVQPAKDAEGNLIDHCPKCHQHVPYIV